MDKSRRVALLVMIFVSAFLALSLMTALAAQTGARETDVVEVQEDLQLELLNQIGGSTADVARQGNYAYAAVGPRLIILDITDPDAPLVVGQTEVLTGVVSKVAVGNGFAYISIDGHLGVVDVRDVAAPSLETIKTIPGRVQDIIISGTRAYVAEGWRYEGSQPYGGGLYLFDVTDPATLFQLDYFVTNDSPSGVDVEGNIAYVASTNGMLVLAVSGPGILSQVNFVPVPLSVAVTVDGTELYVAVQGNGLFIYELTQPLTPTFMTSVSGPFSAVDVVVDSNRAYVAGSTGGLHLFDVTTPASPTPLGNYKLPGFSRAVQVVVSGTRALLA